VHPEDAFATAHVRSVDDDLSVEPPRTKEGGIQHVGTVCGRYQDHAVIGLESIHLDQELVESLLPLIVAATESGTAVPPDRINFVDEDDARSV
jgi:hypothetical protein